MAECISPSNIQFNPLQNATNIAAIHSLSKVTQTAIGPLGKLKILQNADGGHVTVTSSSQRLFQNLSVKNTILKLILSSVKTHLKFYNDSGLYCTLLTLKLIQNSFYLTYPSPLIGKLYQNIGKLYIDCLCLENNSCLMNLNLSDLTELRSFIFCILSSKPGCILIEQDKEHISTLLLKAFLNVIPCSKSVTKLNYAMSFMCFEGHNVKQSKLFNGLLIRRSEAVRTALNQLKRTHNLKAVLFSISLSGDVDFPTDCVETDDETLIWELALKFLKKIISKLISEDINIVTCQKVIHPKLRKILEDNNVLVLDRLGAETAKYFQFLLGIPPISSLSLQSEIKYGIISHITEENFGNSYFYVFTSKENNFSSILLCNYNEEVLSELKVVCQQTIDALFRLLKSQKVCFGAGCTEVFTCHLLSLKVKEKLNEISEETNCSATKVLQVLNAFLQSIYSLSFSLHQGSGLDFVTETEHNHLWKLQKGNFPEGSTNCMCGKYSAKSVGKSVWKFLNGTNCDILGEPNLKGKTENSFEDTLSTVILDELSCKLNALSVAFESASMLLRTSLCIYS